MKASRKLRLFFTTVLMACVWLVGSLPAERVTGRDQKGETKEPYVPGELLVKIRGGAGSKEALSANALMGAKVVETLGDPEWQRVKLPDGLSVDSAISQYSLLRGVEYAQPNFYYHLLATPNDPQFTSSGMYGLTKIMAPAAWDLSTGSSTVVVADIDTGLGYTHQDIALNSWINTGEIAGNGVDDDGNGYVDDLRGYDVFNNDGNPIDDNPSTVWHGTHTAGTIGAVGNNALGVAGVNWNVKIMSLKLYGSTGNGTNSTSAMLVNAYTYIWKMKVQRGINIRVTNNSYGGCGEACGYDQATKDALDAMGDADIVNVFAAGNFGSPNGNNNDLNPANSYPSVYTSPSIISVAASDSNDLRAGFSGYGPISVDLAAPGVGVLSTTFSTTSSYGPLSGTSMATPHVTGAVALLAAYRPDLSAASLKASILNNVDVLPAWATLVKTGGRLNVFKAMQNPTVCTFDTGGVNSIRIRGGRAQDLILNVTAALNCDYMIKSNAVWLTVTNAAPLSGNGVITFHVMPNRTGSPRLGTLSFGGRTFVIRQQPARMVG